MTDRPQPFTTPEMDVRDLDGFMLNVERMMASELVALSTGDEFKAAVRLWCLAWKQVPAGSLSNDERVLAAFSGAGSKWAKVREMALRGFVECSDGRLYHKVLCEDVYRAWSNKQVYLEGKNGDNDRKKREREERSRMFTDLRAVGVTPEWNIPTRALRALVTQHVTRHVTPAIRTSHTPVTPPVTVTVTANTVQDCTVLDCTPSSEPSGSSDGSAPHAAPPPPEMEIPECLDRRKGTRWPEGQSVPDDWLLEAENKRSEHGLSRADLRLEAEKFANYWAAKSGKSATKTNWKLTFINWCLDDTKGTKHVNGSGQKRTATDSHLAGIRALIDEGRAGGFAARAQGDSEQG